MNENYNKEKKLFFKGLEEAKEIVENIEIEEIQVRGEVDRRENIDWFNLYLLSEDLYEKINQNEVISSNRLTLTNYIHKKLVIRYMENELKKEKGDD